MKTPMEELLLAVRSKAVSPETLQAVEALVHAARGAADGIEGGQLEPDYAVSASLRAAADLVSGGPQLSLNGMNEEVGRHAHAEPSDGS
jgi:hypothetical protein